MGSIPGLPASKGDDSILSQKYGPESTNYFSNSPLNRLSFLREDHAFLKGAFSHPETNFLLMNELAPLIEVPTDLQFVKLAEVVSVTGADPFGLPEEDMIKNYDSTDTRPLLIFLGILEDPASAFQYKSFKGQPIFAIDITPKEPYAAAAKALVENQTQSGRKFNQTMRQVTLSAGPGELRSPSISLYFFLSLLTLGSLAAIFAQARTVIDWNNRNQFCAGCGHRSLPVHAGYKRVCPPSDREGAAESKQRPDCATRTGISNLSFPRTDPSMIAAVVSADGKRLLLGRQKRWPPHLYSNLAGFLETGESLEDAVRREVWEESGVRVGRVVLHSTQPWPYPAVLMLGAVAQALPDGETINLGNDPELEAAKWFTIDEVRDALKVGVSGLGEPAPAGYKEGNLRLPPHTAIANRLLTAVVEGFLNTGSKI
jgi:NAD+ diphosphatase